MIVFLYILNGFLALFWLIIDHILLLLIVPALTWLAYTAPVEQRYWTLVACVFVLLSTVFVPMPAPFMMLSIAWAGVIAIRFDSFNTPGMRWNTVRGLALYSLVSIGYLLFANAMPAIAGENPLLIQGQTYLSAIAAFAMYLIPLGFLALLAQSLWAHPPLPGKPVDLTYAIRARGKGD